MPRDNSVWVRGRLTADPHFEVLDGKTPHCRFRLAVLRDASQQARHPSSPAGGPKTPPLDLLRISVYGERAGLDYFYLRKGAEIAVSGWNESRRYHDKRLNRHRMVQEINAQSIVFGAGCDFSRGDAQRQRKLEEALEQGRTNLDAFGGPALDTLTDQFPPDLED